MSSRMMDLRIIKKYKINKKINGNTKYNNSWTTPATILHIDNWIAIRSSNKKSNGSSTSAQMTNNQEAIFLSNNNKPLLYCSTYHNVSKNNNYSINLIIEEKRSRKVLMKEQIPWSL